MGKFALILLLVVSCCYGSNVLLTNPNSLGVTNRVTALLVSQDTLAWQNVSNAIINPDMPVGYTNLSELKVSNNVVMYLSAVDSNNITIAISNIVWQSRTNREFSAKQNATNVVEDFIEDGRVLRAFAEVVMDEVNILRTRTTTNALPVRTLLQLKNAIIGKIIAQPDFNP